MNDRAFPDDAIGIHRHPWVETAVVPYSGFFSDGAAGVKHNALAQARARADTTT
jgi:hypothetical protein